MADWVIKKKYYEAGVSDPYLGRLKYDNSVNCLHCNPPAIRSGHAGQRGMDVCVCVCVCVIIECEFL